MPVIALIIIGAAAGFLATRMMRIETGIVATVAIGVLGALIGGLILRSLIALASWAAGFVGAILGALLLIWLWQRYAPKD